MTFSTTRVRRYGKRLRQLRARLRRRPPIIHLDAYWLDSELTYAA